MIKTAAYGTWESPLTAERVTAHQKRFGDVWIDGDDIYWDEMRPTEGGRTVIVKRTKEGTNLDMTPEHFSARTRVHEYGGGAFTVHEGVVYWVNDKDQCIYRDRDALTAPGTRFADLVVTDSYLIAVGEQGTDNFL